MEPTVLVDTIPIAPGRSSAGVRVYLRELLEAIPEQERPRVRLLCSTSNQELFQDLEGYHRTVLPWATPSRALRVLTQQLVVPIVALRTRAHVLFEPIDHGAVLSPVPLVTSFHSSHLNLHHGLMRGWKRWYNRHFLSWTVRRSARVIAISAHVRDTLVALLGADPSRIDVVHHGGGIAERILGSGGAPVRDEDRDGGILFVSTLYPHKNVEALLRAHAKLREGADTPPRLTIVGADHDGEGARLETLAEALGTRGSVCFAGPVTDDELRGLLVTSRLMVYPSSLEGFGLPAVEAMQAGLPLIVADRASLPEIVDDGALLVDPEDVDALADAMRRVLGDAELRRHLVERGRARGRHFSWPKTARRTLEVLDRAAGAPPGRRRGPSTAGSPS